MCFFLIPPLLSTSFRTLLKPKGEPKGEPKGQISAVTFPCVKKIKPKAVRRGGYNTSPLFFLIQLPGLNLLHFLTPFRNHLPRDLEASV